MHASARALPRAPRRVCARLFVEAALGRLDVPEARRVRLDPGGRRTAPRADAPLPGDDPGPWLIELGAAPTYLVPGAVPSEPFRHRLRRPRGGAAHLTLEPLRLDRPRNASHGAPTQDPSARMLLLVAAFTRTSEELELVKGLPEGEVGAATVEDARARVACDAWQALRVRGEPALGLATLRVGDRLELAPDVTLCFTTYADPEVVDCADVAPHELSGLRCAVCRGRLQPGMRAVHCDCGALVHVGWSPPITTLDPPHRCASFGGCPDCGSALPETSGYDWLPGDERKRPAPSPGRLRLEERVAPLRAPERLFESAAFDSLPELPALAPSSLRGGCA